MMPLNTHEYREQLICEGRISEASQAFKEAVESAPRNPNLLFNAGMGAFLTGRVAEAAAYWTRVKDVVPQDIPIRARLIQVYDQL
jgi:cytochrome c-type biogenesis protein CcmH/NrfG